MWHLAMPGKKKKVMTRKKKCKYVTCPESTGLL